MGKSKGGFSSFIKIVLLLLLALLILVSGLLMNSAVAVCKEAPDINPHDINDLLTENSIIKDQDGNVIEKIESSEYRDIVTIDDMPKHLQDAFVSVEDERFWTHRGIDPQGVIRSIYDNIKSGGIVQGASTITQQLARNMYLNNEVSFERKIKEMYLSLKIEDQLSKEEILEAYLNRVFLGQNAYGVQAASKTYFSKDVKDLSVLESAALASIVQSPTNNALYKTYSPESLPENSDSVGEVEINGKPYICVANKTPYKRISYVLNKMNELGELDDKTYQEIDVEDLTASIKPGRRDYNDLTTCFSDLLKEQVIYKLVDEKKLTYENAKSLLYTGGLEITATIDKDMQEDLEDLYGDFSQILNGDISENSNPPGLNLSFNNSGDILDKDGKILYYKKENILEDNGDFLLDPKSFSTDQSGLLIKSDKVKLKGSTLTFGNFYSQDEDRNLVTHTGGHINFEDKDVKAKGGGILISQDFIDENREYFKREGDYYRISKDLFGPDLVGLVQPQSSLVVIDHRTGHIKALIGGREREDDEQYINRASSEARQPGSTIKPFSAYIPAIDSGKSLAYPIDDVPHYNEKGDLWPQNWYKGYRGIQTIRESLRDSINVNTVKLIEEDGMDKSLEYLGKFGIINEKHPDRDHYISPDENPGQNDENLAALGLGSFSRGTTNLEMTGAYAALANGGTYIEPLTFSQIKDNKGNIIFDDDNEKREAVSPQVAFQITDVLKEAVDEGSARGAQLDGIDACGKTGTTQYGHDFWFCGYTPYYTVGFWMGADNQQIELSGNSSQAAEMWGVINRKILKGREDKEFERPEGIIEKKVCTKSGKLPTDACYQDPREVVKTEIFTKENLPTTECDVHQWKTIGGRTVSVVVRPIPYDPGENDGILPDDWAYSTGSSGSYKKRKKRYTETEPEKEDYNYRNEREDDDRDDMRSENNETEGNRKKGKGQSHNERDRSNSSKNKRRSDDSSNKKKPETEGDHKNTSPDTEPERPSSSESPSEDSGSEPQLVETE